jgi:hypothetical protein
MSKDVKLYVLAAACIYVRMIETTALQLFTHTQSGTHAERALSALHIHSCHSGAQHVPRKQPNHGRHEGAGFLRRKGPGNLMCELAVTALDTKW